jgi:flagellar biosynthetic protein FliQ
MDIPQVIDLGRDLLYTALLLSLPALGVSLVVGLLVSIFQTVTSIQEQTLSFVPRVLAVGVAMLLTLPWTLQIAIHFTVRMFTQMAEVGR